MPVIPTSLLINYDCANLQTANTFTNFHAFVCLSALGHKNSKLWKDANVVDLFAGITDEMIHLLLATSS